MPTYQRADEEVEGMAKAILERFESHTPLVKAKVTFDFIFAFPTLNDEGQATGDAIKKNGVKALGLCRIINLKDRTMGRADVEILLDHPWWEDATDEQREALLDHELHHASVKLKNGVVQRDDLQRPLIKLRKHDVEVGWFDIIALRHGPNSQERIQAKSLADEVGQLYWPDLCGKLDPLGAAKLLKRHGGNPSGLTPVVASKSFDEDEDLVEQCVEVIRSEQKASVSLLQRRLRLGYARADRIMDELERRGIVGPAKGAEPRDILIDLEANKPQVA